jgi:hypothetical protein
VHFPEELARPENAGLSATVAALADVKAKIDAKGLTAPLSWTDAISWAARVRVGGLHAALRALADEALQLPRQTRTKSAFDAIVVSRAAPGNAELLLKAYGNEVRPARS